MRTTGIIRRIDELGRVVIPKEIRKTMRLKVGEEMEIYSQGEDLVLKKFSTIGHLEDYATSYAEALSEVTDCTVLICDNDRVIAVSGENKRLFQEKILSNAIIRLFAERNIRTLLNENIINIADEDISISQQIISPIMSNGDIIGGIIIQSQVAENASCYIKLIDVASRFLGSIL